MKNFLPIILFFLLLYSCKKDPVLPDPTDPVSPPVAEITPDIYLTGSANYNGLTVATYIKNGIRRRLTRQDTVSEATEIVADGKDIYIPGYISVNGESKAVYWKNGQINILEGAMGIATDMCLSDGNIYVCGSVKPDSRTETKAVYWKNGKMVLLPDIYGGSVPSWVFTEANGIAVLKDVVHVVGKRVAVDQTDAAYWKNNTGKSLSCIPEMAFCPIASANDIALLGDDVHIIGNVQPWMHYSIGNLDNGVCYWKNGEVVRLSGNEPYSRGKRILAHKGKIYILAGLGSRDQQTYWEGSMKKLFFQDYLTLYSMAFYNDDIYFAGNHNLNGWPNLTLGTEDLWNAGIQSGPLKGIAIVAP